MELSQRIEQAQANVSKAEQQETILKTQKEEAEKQLQEAENEVKALGFTPANLETEIASLEASLEKDLTEIENMLPKVD
jgi:chromosome segregation ATPase